MKPLNSLTWQVLGMLAVVGHSASAMAQSDPPVTGGDLACRAAATGEVARGELTGQAAEYLRQALNTQAKIYGEAKVVKVIDDNCARVNIKISIPDVMVSYPDVTKPGTYKLGPFETTTEGKFCDEYLK